MVDAQILSDHCRYEGALLVALLAVQATARKAHPRKRDREAFEEFLRGAHTTSVSVEYRGSLVDVDHLFWKWLRCELVHTGSLPVDLRIDCGFADPGHLVIRAGGHPDFTVLITPGWFRLFIRAVIEAPVNAGEQFPTS